MDYFVKAYKDWKFHSQFQEIVPDDMDDEYIFNEKQSIRESARSLKKYGSTCHNHNIRNSADSQLIRHEIEKTDTLQGIALKYGCSTEQIRRANRLFASDSLFLRQCLLVPVDKTSPFYPKAADENHTAQLEAALANIDDTTTQPPTTAAARIGAAPASNASDATSANNPRPSALPARPYSIAGELPLVQTSEDDAALNNHNASSSKQSKSLDSVAAMTPEEENRKCINEFLSKIDTTISESRKYVEKSKEMITSQSDNDLFVASDIVHRRSNHINTSYKNNNNRQTHQNHVRQSSSGSTSDTAQLLNTTQTRRVQNSLKRLEKQQDEFFEL